MKEEINSINKTLHLRTHHYKVRKLEAKMEEWCFWQGAARDVRKHTLRKHKTKGVKSEVVEWTKHNILQWSVCVTETQKAHTFKGRVVWLKMKLIKITECDTNICQMLWKIMDFNLKILQVWQLGYYWTVKSQSTTHWHTQGYLKRDMITAQHTATKPLSTHEEERWNSKEWKLEIMNVAEIGKKEIQGFMKSPLKLPATRGVSLRQSVAPLGGDSKAVTISTILN